MKTKFQLLFLFILCITVTSCKKFKANKFAGKYACQVNYHLWSMLPESIDTTYREDIVVDRNQKELTVLNVTFAVDSVLKERKYVRVMGIQDRFSVQFLKDSMYLATKGGSLGAKYSRSYACSKK